MLESREPKGSFYFALGRKIDMITNKKVRVDGDNIEFVRGAVFPEDQYVAISRGSLVTTAAPRNGGHITVLHDEGKAFYFDGNAHSENRKSIVGDWIDSVGLVCLPSGKMVDLNGNIVQ